MNQQNLISKTFPPLPLDAWEDTKSTLHLYLQIIGKIRLTLHPKMNHWWHVPLYVTSYGLTTRSIPYQHTSFIIDMDLLNHYLKIRTSEGAGEQFTLDSLSVADFYKKIFSSLAKLGINVSILAKPYDHKSKLPFAEDTMHNSYDKEYVNRFWGILLQVDSIFQKFRGRFLGKSTPVHLFWHSFDLALTRFSGKAGPPMPEGAGKVEREAYSHEVISFGFWAGDDKVRGPAFYSYTFPTPEKIDSEPLKPAQARWIDANGSPMALLSYDDMRNSDDPEQTLLDFLESAYQAGAKTAGWDIDAMELKTL